MVIDFHVHAFNPKVAEKAVEKLQAQSGITPFTRGTAEETIQRFDEWGIDKGVLLSVATKPAQQRVINDWCAQQDGGRFISFGGIHPDAEDYEQEIAHIKELGLHGIKLHPDYQGFMIDDERMDKIYDAIERADLPVIFHSGYDCVSPDIIHSTPERALNMIKKHHAIWHGAFIVLSLYRFRRYYYRLLGVMMPRYWRDLMEFYHHKGGQFSRI